MGIAKKNIAKALEDYLAKEGCLEDPFSKQILRNYQPCVSTRELLNNQRMCQSKKDCLFQLMPKIFHPATYEEHSINNHDLNRVLFWKPCNGKKCINSYKGLGVG